MSGGSSSILRAGMKFSDDVSRLLFSAAESLTPGDMIKSAHYNSADGLHAIEIMDPKLDPASVPNRHPDIAACIRDGRLCVHNLDTDLLLRILENIITLEVLATMRATLGLPAAPHLLDSDIPDISVSHVTYFTRKLKETVSAEEHVASSTTPTRLCEAVAIEALKPDSAEYQNLYILYTFIVLTLKACEARHKAVMFADLFHDDDYYSNLGGIDLAFGVTPQEMFALADRAHAYSCASSALSSIDSSSSFQIPTAFSWLQQTTGVNKLTNLLRFRIAFTTATLLLQPTSAVRHEKLPWGSTYPLAHVFNLCKAAHTHLSAYGDFTECHGDGTAAAAPPVWISQLYATTFFSSTPPRFLPLPKPSVTLQQWKQQLADVCLLCNLPEYCSYNPLRPYLPSDQKIRSVCGGVSPITEISSYPIQLLDVFLSTNARVVETEGAFSGTAARAEEAKASAAAGKSPRYLPTPPIPTTIPYAAAIGSAIPAVTSQLPPRLAASGAMDPPLVILRKSDSGALDPQKPFEGVSADFVNGNSKRQHLSLQALLRFLLEFSKRNCNVVTRSWLCNIMIESAPIAAVSTHPELEDYAFSSSKSPILFGSHTLTETVRSALVDAGVTAEELVTVECRKCVGLMDGPIHSLLRVLCCTRLRLRRKMDVHLRDWAIIAQEADGLDGLYAAYISNRAAAADSGWLAKKGVIVSGESYLQHASDDDHRHLHMLNASQTTSRMLPWVMDVIVRLMLTHLEIGFECELYNVDELAAVYWYMDNLYNILGRQQRMLEYASQMAAGFPELRMLTQETLARCLKGGDGDVISLYTPPPKAPAEDGDAVAVVASSKGGKAGKKKKPVNEETQRQLLHTERSRWVEQLLRFTQTTHMVTSAYSLERDEISLRGHLCKAYVRVLAALQAAGFIRGLGDASAAEDSTTPFFRTGKLAFERRFRDFACFTIPQPLSYESYLESFHMDEISRLTVVRLISDATVHVKHAIEYCKRAINGYRDPKCMGFGTTYDEFIRDKTAKEAKDFAHTDRLRAMMEERLPYTSPQEIMPLQQPFPVNPLVCLLSSNQTTTLLTYLRAATTLDAFIGKTADVVNRVPTEPVTKPIPLVPSIQRARSEPGASPSFRTIKLA